MNNTKVIVTMGKSCLNINVLRDLFSNGMDVARFNMSYCSYEFCLDIINKINKLNDEYSKKIAIMMDIAGPEIKVGKIENNKAYLSQGDKIRIYMDDIIGDKTKFSSNYNLVKYLKTNDIIKVNNGKIVLSVIEIGSNYLLCEVIIPGEIETGSNITVKNIKLDVPFLNKKDKEDIKFACKNNFDFLALSLVSTYDDVLSVNDLLIESGNDHIDIFAKIEKEEAISEIDDIIKICDGVIIARGDLGTEVPMEDVPIIQKNIISKCKKAGKIGIVSTDFLASMENSLMPTRAEVSDVSNAVIDGADVILLSDETANGLYPVETIKILEKIIYATETGMPNFNRDYIDDGKDVTSAVSYSVVECANKLKCLAIVSPTISGHTAKKLSHFRPNCPVIALSPNVDVIKNLSLRYGVYPVLISEISSFDDIIEIAKKCTKSIMKTNESDKIIITGGYPFSKVKHTNFMKIEEL